MRKVVVFIPIAARDVDFYISTAQSLLKLDPNLKVAFASLFQPGRATIEAAGFKNYDIYGSQAFKTTYEMIEVKRNFNLPNLHALILHEKLTFGITSDQSLHQKLAGYLYSANELLQEIKKDYPADDYFISQELAGFIGPLSFHYAGLTLGFRTLFSEPAFFKGRIHLNEGLYEADIIKDQTTRPETIKEVESYIQKSLQQQVVVAAAKDAHHFKDMGLKKVFNLTNFKKLKAKIWAKYFTKEKQEFDHIWNHTRRYLEMLRNRWLNSKNYSTIKDLPIRKILYFPFHVQLDFSLTIRSAEYLDQLGLLERLCTQLPEEYVLIAKEHPASIGCLDQGRLKKLLKNDNFFLMHPLLNSHELIKKCVAVVTINSKVGAESLLYEKPVFSFGKAFYTHQSFTKQVSRADEVVQQLISHPNLKMYADPVAWKNFLARIWESTWPVELYDPNPQYVENFAKAHLEKIEKITSF